jgi:kumamolisin
MKRSLIKTGMIALFLAPLGVAADAEPAAAAGRAADLGALAALGRGGETMSVTLPLSLRDPAGAEAMMVRTATPGDRLYHQFLTPAQIRAAFGPDESQVARATTFLSLSGLSVERPSSTILKVTGTVSTIERVFQTELHQFAVPSAGEAPGFTFRAATRKPVVPVSIAGTVQGMIGMSDAPALKPKSLHTLAGSAATVIGPFGNASTGTPFGQLTVTDFAKLYDVEPLYADGITGAGRTVAVVTLASFIESDVTAYWQALGLKTKPNRITVVNVDGGSGAPSDASGSDETTLDVAQSGGIAPQADIIVYEAPNTDQAFLDDFAKAVEDNIADSISTSFGEWEVFDSANQLLGNGPVADVFSGEMVTFLQAAHEVFVLGGLQGQSLFAASGDDGAFDTFRDFIPGVTSPLTVDYPASDSAITAAGGTTLPGTQTFELSSGATVSVTNPQERVWAEDYLGPVCQAAGFPHVANCDILFNGGLFPIGGGGGISVFFPVPSTQLGLPGVLLTQPNQSLIDENASPPTDLLDLPANFPGRNTPDFVYNADPDTGYELFYTSSAVGFHVFDFFGGTSFVAPQLNGVTALLGQNAGHRFGLLNIPLYLLARTGIATLGPNPALHTISTGDNWFFTARNGFSPAAGLGTIEVANLAALLK